MSVPPSPKSSGEARTIPLLNGAACAGIFVFGIVMALLGAILPTLSGRLAFAPADIGALFLVMNGAMLVSSLLLGVAMDRFGMKPPLVVGPLLVALALAIVAEARAFAALWPAVALLGVGGGALNGAANTLVADLHQDARRKSAALSRLGIFFGFGALFLPFAIGTLLARMAVEPLLTVAAVLCAAVGIFALLLRFPPAKQGHALPAKEVPRFLRSPLVVVFACLLFFESGVEFTLGGFISIYLTRALAVASVAAASQVLAAYWAAIMISRAVLSRAALGADPYRVLMACGSAAAGGAMLAAVAPQAWIAAVGVVICGAALAGVYPAALGIAGDRFPAHSGTVFGILFTVALSGGMTLPWLAGQIGGTIGLRWVFGMVAAAFVAIAVLSRVAAAVGRTATRG